MICENCGIGHKTKESWSLKIPIDEGTGRTLHFCDLGCLVHWGERLITLAKLREEKEKVDSMIDNIKKEKMCPTCAHRMKDHIESLCYIPGCTCGPDRYIPKS